MSAEHRDELANGQTLSHAQKEPNGVVHNYSVVGMLAGVAVFVLLMISGIVAYGWPFIGGYLLVGIGGFAFVCWSLGEVAP